ncbi:MAG: hypothetical protein IE913_00015 [Halothiobacillus sp.]|nr:hypothetical protein [Halothiobacillus sp.]
MPELVCADLPVWRKVRRKAFSYIALAAPKRTNPFFVGRKMAIEVAKRAGILDDAGDLQLFYR